MASTMSPFNIYILDTNTDRFKYIKPVTSLDIFQGMTRDFHEEGLFSTSIFGAVGTDERDNRFSYIDVKVDIFHPKIYYLLCSLKQLYKQIMAGTTYARWDKNERDFVKSTNLDGDTGFNFFMQHWRDIIFKKNDSYLRTQSINVIDKYKEVATTHRVMVMPAGFRDVEIDENGQPTKNEINDFYLRILSIANSLSSSSDLNSPLIDRSRHSLQMAFNEVYDFLKKFAGEEKKSFMRHKWGRRKIQYGTRNVFTAINTTPQYIGDPRAIRFNETAVGLYQMAAATLPVLAHSLLTGYLTKVFRSGESKAWLINPKSLRREEVEISPRQGDRWRSVAGIEKVINSFSDAKLRNQPIEINGHYLGLVYKTDEHFKLLDDIDELPGELKEKTNCIFPLTYGELLYIHGYKWFNKKPACVTRYPIEGDRSIYPSYPHVITTTQNKMLIELDDEFKPLEDHIAIHYPDTNWEDWFDSLGPHPSRLEGMGGDFDGDTGNYNVSLSQESQDAVARYLNTLQAYVNSDGKLRNNPITETIERVLWAMTSEVK